MTPATSHLSHIRRQLLRRAVLDSFVKLDPRRQVRNPVMFVVEAGSVLTTLLFLQALIGRGEESAGFVGGVAAWLWFTSGWVIKTYVGHTAVAAELIRTGTLDRQGKGVAAYGVAVAEEVFGEVGNVMNYQRNFDHVLGTVQDSIAAGVSFLPSSIAFCLFFSPLQSLR